jgi:uncharacterized protein (TIGR02453 family)
MSARYFTPELFTFLHQLAENNNRAWFKAHQVDYERLVREPALDFITDFSRPLRKISGHFTADARKAGGSLFRINRDTRFATDKSPYKTNTGMHFRHEDAQNVHAPGFYVHLEPGESFMGVGIWRPHTETAYSIRRRIDEHPDAWRKAAHGRRFADGFALEGESLVRPPKGFAPDHPLIDDLKRKDFIASRRLTEEEVTSEGFLDGFTRHCTTAAPFMRFLCEAVGVPF